MAGGLTPRDPAPASAPGPLPWPELQQEAPGQARGGVSWPT
jgi:hypothetical protein